MYYRIDHVYKMVQTDIATITQSPRAIQHILLSKQNTYANFTEYYRGHRDNTYVAHSHYYRLLTCRADLWRPFI